MVSSSSIFAWKIPDVHCRKHSESPVTVPNPPLFVQKFKKKRTVDYFSLSSYQRTADWYDSANDGMSKVFDVIERKGGSASVACHMYYMKDVVNPETSIVEKDVFYHSTVPVIFDKSPRANIINSPYYVCNDSLLRLTHHRNNVCILTSPLDLGPDGEQPPTTLIDLQLLPTHVVRCATIYMSTASLDPMTARLAYISEMNLREIVVVDYV